MTQFCLMPFTRIQINPDGEVYPCFPGWLPTSIGNIFHAPLPEIWNSDRATAIRKTVVDGTFAFCNSQTCSRLIAGKKIGTRQLARGWYNYVRTQCSRYIRIFDRGPRMISLSYDYSCNLYCKSCRRERHVLDQTQREKIIAFQRVFLRSPYFKDARRFMITEYGDPFASQVYMDLLQHIPCADNPTLKITLRTNGILLTPQNWEHLKNVHDAIDQIWISIDAATANTYRLLRRGGDFQTLLHNLAFLRSLKYRHPLTIRLCFLVQQSNYREMEQFVTLAKTFHCDCVQFQRLLNNPSIEDEYQEMAVHQPTHPEFPELKKILNQPIFKDPIIHLSDLSHVFD